MRIRMLTSSAGPAGNRSAGQEYDVADAEGAALCAGNYAVPVHVEVVERAVVVAPEVAVMEPRANAPKPKPKR
jgi:hypothetical protein